ncbi:MAG: hypothetical protein GEV07_12660 [Streptosporangiales bacterium]|nr:hypothetical protein [Streptosporangiales bacterium]
MAFEAELFGRKFSFTVSTEGRVDAGRSVDQETRRHRRSRHAADREQTRRRADGRAEQQPSREGATVDQGVRRGEGWLSRLRRLPGRRRAPSRSQAAEVEGRAGTPPDQQQENEPNRSRGGRHRARRAETRRAALARQVRTGVEWLGQTRAGGAVQRTWAGARSRFLPGRTNEGKTPGVFALLLKDKQFRQAVSAEARTEVPKFRVVGVTGLVVSTAASMAAAGMTDQPILNPGTAGFAAALVWALRPQGYLGAAAAVRARGRDADGKWWSQEAGQAAREQDGGKRTNEPAGLGSREAGREEPVGSAELDERLARLPGGRPDAPSVDSQQQRPVGENDERAPAQAQQEVGGRATLGAPPTPAQEPEQQQTPAAGKPQQAQGQQVDPRQATMVEAAQWRDLAMRGAEDATQRRDKAQQDVEYLTGIQAQAGNEAQQQEQIRHNATAWAGYYQQEAQRHQQEFQQGAPWAEQQAAAAQQAAQQAQQAAMVAAQSRDVHARNAGEIGQQLEAAKQQVTGAETERQQYLQAAGQAEHLLTSLEQQQQPGQTQEQQPVWPQHDQDRAQGQPPNQPQRDPHLVQGQVQQGTPGQPQPTPPGREQSEEPAGPVPTGAPQQPPQPGAFVAPQPTHRGGEQAPTERPAAPTQQPTGGKPGKFADQFRDGRHSVGYSQTGRRGPNADRRTNDRDKTERPGPNGPGHTPGPS